MIRLILLIALLYILYLVITKPLSQLFGSKRSSFQRPKKPASSPVPRPDAEEMAACALCGTFISKREGEIREGKFVCKTACHDTVGVG